MTITSTTESTVCVASIHPFSLVAVEQIAVGFRIVIPGGAADAAGTADSGHVFQSLRLGWEQQQRAATTAVEVSYMVFGSKLMYS